MRLAIKFTDVFRSGAFPNLNNCLKRHTRDCPKVARMMYEGLTDTFEYSCSDARDGKFYSNWHWRLSDSRHNFMLDFWRWFITARKRSLGQGIIFTSFCLSVHRGCLCTWGGGVCPERGSPCLGGSLSGGCLSRGSLSWRPPCYGGRMGGPHPTGMNSCLL